MIYLIAGENAYITKHELAHIVRDVAAEPEHVDVSTLTIAQLADLVRAQVLFAPTRLIVCRSLSDHKQVWDKLGEWIDEVSDDTTLVLIEPKLDKRTKAYKAISARARVIAADQLADRDWHKAESWLDEYAHAHKVKLSRMQLSDMVQRAYVPDTRPGRQLIDQQQLAIAIEALVGSERVTDDMIATVMPTGSQGTVFDILQYAVSGEGEKVQDLMLRLRHQEEPLAVFPSLMSQWTQLVEVALVGERGAGELGIHPYVVQKLAKLAREVPRDRLKSLTELGARLDADMKRSAIEPWDAIDRFILAIRMR